MGLLDGKVAFVTGAARGQGRSHAVRLAEECAVIVAVDLATSISSVPYALSEPEDLARTVELVEAVGGRILAATADVREQSSLDAVVAEAVKRFERIDIVCANAGIVSYGPTWELTEHQWRDIVDVNLTGAWHTVKATIPTMISGNGGGSIVLTSSTAAFQATPNIAAYSASKHGLVGLMWTLSAELAPHRIRVNTVHPTTVPTDMILNEATFRLFCPDLADPTEADFRHRLQERTPMGVPWVEPQEVSNAVLWLVSDQSRYVTGISLPVTAGNANN
jgi:SDR family mycofactocin-dependent oxidoreductase